MFMKCFQLLGTKNIVHFLAVLQEIQESRWGIPLGWGALMDSSGKEIERREDQGANKISLG